MPATLGYHIVLSAYGLWLPGDDRGSWSESWDEQIGFTEPHTLHLGDPVRRRMAEERMSHSAVRFSPPMLDVTAETIGRCASNSPWNLAAASIEPTHTHLLMTYSPRSINDTVKWLKDQITKAIHDRTDHAGPVWCKGKWRAFIFEEGTWTSVRQYIERHNVRRGVGPRPYSFLV
jgi:REP element-mobilizing transposase RayT